MKKMMQQVVTAPHKIEFVETDLPEMREGCVLIKVMRMGICGSDIHVFHGQHPYTSYPITQGHEISGLVVEVAEDVKHIKAGQKVTIEPQVVCGECYPCRHGKYNLCDNLKVMGFQTTGAASEYFLVHQSKVDVLPDSMTYDEGALIEPLAVVVHACRQAGDVKDKNVIVIGSGPIGVLLIQTLKALGTKTVMATDISDYRLQLAKSSGADFVFNTENEDFGKAVIETFGKDKADLIFDCAGTNTSMANAIEHARKGSMIILVAVFAKMAEVDLAKLNDSEIDLNSTMMYRHEDYIDAIRLVSEGKINLESIISKHFDFKDFQKAYEHIDNNKESTMKVLIDINP